MSSILSSQKIENLLLLVIPLVMGIAGTGLAGIVPGTTGFLLGVVLAALAKSGVGLGQNPNSYEDILQFIITTLGLVATGLSANPAFVVYGIVIGFIAKALPSMANGVNWDDVLLTIGAVLAGIGQYFGLTALASVGLLLGVLGKSLPNLGPKPVPAPAPAPAATATTAS